MSVQFDSNRQRWVVRWYDAGRQRTRRFAEEPAARVFDEQQRAANAAARDAGSVALAGELGRLVERVETIEQRLPADARTRGVTAYATRQRVRWRVAVPRADGRVTTRRGYETHAAARAALSSALDDAMGRGLPLDNPCRHAPPLHVERHEPDYLRLAEIGPHRPMYNGVSAGGLIFSPRPVAGSGFGPNPPSAWLR
jgi:hypothetical protein